MKLLSLHSFSTAFLIMLFIVLSGCNLTSESETETTARGNTHISAQPDSQSTEEIEGSSQTKTEAELNLQTTLNSLVDLKNNLKLQIDAAGENVSQATLAAWAQVETQANIAAAAVANFQDTAQKNWEKMESEARAEIDALKREYTTAKTQFMAEETIASEIEASATYIETKASFVTEARAQLHLMQIKLDLLEEKVTTQTDMVAKMSIEFIETAKIAYKQAVDAVDIAADASAETWLSAKVTAAQKLKTMRSAYQSAELSITNTTSAEVTSNGKSVTGSGKNMTTGTLQ